MKILPFAFILISLAVSENGVSQDLNYTLNSNISYSTSEQDDYLKIVFKSFSTTYYQGGKTIGKEEFESKLETNPTAYQEYTLGKNLNTLGNGIGIPSAAVFGYTMGRMIAGDKPNGALVAGSGICWGGAIVLDLIGQAKRRSSVKAYNASVTSDESGIRLAINEQGVGVAIRF